MLGELAGIGLTAGLLGAALALPLSALLGLHPSPTRGTARSATSASARGISEHVQS